MCTMQFRTGLMLIVSNRFCVEELKTEYLSLANSCKYILFSYNAYYSMVVVFLYVEKINLDCNSQS